MALLDLLSRRWALRVIWELRGAALGFNALAQACERVPPATLSRRLGELAGAGVVADEGGAWGLTVEGRRLLEALLPLSAWAERWAKRGGR